MKARNLIRTLNCAAFVATATLAHAGSHTWSGAINNGWSNAGNWSSGGAPQYGEPNVILIFPASATRYAATNGIGNIAIDSIQILGSNYSIGGYGITLTGVAYYNLVSDGTNNVISLPMTLNSPNEYFYVDTYDSLTLSGALSGPGGFFKFGRGQVTLTGPDSNTYASKTVVKEGLLDLAKPPFLNAVPSDLVIGDESTNPYWVEVKLENDHQVDDSANVTVNPYCDFYLRGHMEVIHDLRLNTGSVIADIPDPAVPGQLTIFGNVTVTNSYPQPSSISGHFSLAGQVRTIDISDIGILDITAAVVDGGQTAGILKTGTGTLILEGSNTYSGNTTVQNGTLRINSGMGLGSTAGGTYVQPGASLELGPVTIGGEHLYLNGTGFVPFLQTAGGALLADQANAFWAGPVTLQSASTVFVATNLNLTISGVIDGPGQLTKDGDGSLLLAGSSANTFSGGTLVGRGILNLGKTAGITALPGPITIGITNVGTHNAYIQLMASQQIPDSVPLTSLPSGVFYLNGYFETIGGLNLFGSLIVADGGLLTLHGDVNAHMVRYGNQDYDAVMSGHYSLGGATREFHVDGGTNSLLIVFGDITDGGNNAGITKTGDAELQLVVDNSYTGVTTINEGLVSVSSPLSLGSPAGGTLVKDGATLSVGYKVQIAAEPLTILGTGIAPGFGALLMDSNSVWGGNVVIGPNSTVAVQDPTAIAIITGVIGGTGSLHKVGPGTLSLAGAVANNYNGRTFVDEGTLWLSKTNATAIPGSLVIGSGTNAPNHETVRLQLPDQIADSSDVTVNFSGLLTFNPFTAQAETIGSLTGNGNVDMLLAKLTVGGNNASTVFDGNIAGVGFGSALIKEGTGALTLTGTNTCNGSTVINNGHLYVNGMAPNSSVVLNPNGQLHGQGTVGIINGVGGWTVPGDNLGSPAHGMLHSSSINLDANSDFNIDLGGTAASGKYDQLKVTGTVNLGSATFHMTQSGMANTNDQFVIIQNDGNDPVVGTFAGFPEGSVFALNASQQFKISYAGGDGNDVVITQLVTPPAPDLGSITMTNGQIQIEGQGVPKWVYAVEATEDLGNPNSWQAIGQATADGNGVITFVDVDAPKHSARFYRFKAP